MHGVFFFTINYVGFCQRTNRQRANHTVSEERGGDYRAMASSQGTFSFVCFARGLTVFSSTFFFSFVSSSRMTTTETSSETVHADEAPPAPRERDEYGFYKGCELDAISGGLAHSEYPENICRRAEDEWARARDEYQHRGTVHSLRKLASTVGIPRAERAWGWQLLSGALQLRYDHRKDTFHVCTCRCASLLLLP